MTSISFLKSLIEKHRTKVNERNQNCDNLIAQFSVALEIIKEHTSDIDRFVDLTVADEWKKNHASLKESANIKLITKLKRASNYKKLKASADSFNEAFNSVNDIFDGHNKKVAEHKINEAYLLIGKVEGRRLDKQQMLAIVKEAHSHLIIAGAGTGKTTTVVGKIKYLIKSGKCSPSAILVLSFTNASASEMSERISRETECDIAASTFHKLGLNIITEVEGIKPKISQINLRTFIKEQLKELLKNPDYSRMLSKYLLYDRVPAKSEFDFSSRKEYSDYLNMNPPITINGERVKSYGELDIANFLFENGVKYVYEAEYKYDTRTAEYGAYHPDFYLPDYDIYIEHFGIDKNGNVPQWFSSSGRLNPTQAYQKQIEWKRKVHKKNKTVLVECYSYEKYDGTLLSSLQRKLTELGVEFNPKPVEELWSEVAQSGERLIDGIIELFETVINLLKSNNYTIEKFKALASSSGNANHYLNFIDLMEPILTAYESALKANDEIDFNDMINKAAEYVRSGKYSNPYSFVIVDEYQDISKSRYALLAALRESHDYDLFCVGDDWQSIYRFAGSDISYILNFKKYWGAATISKIETTYRFSPSLIEISGTFITQNPYQIKKSIRSLSPSEQFSLGEINGYTDKYTVEFMASKMDDLPRGKSVFLIGRYTFDVDIIKDCNLFDCKYNNVTGFVDVKYSKRPDLKIQFLTAHKSKGLQADYVFIINNKSIRMGFPSQIQDDPILELLLDNSESFPFAEERRLYYVALTRAKEKAFMLTVKDKESVFAKELERRYARQLKGEQFECPLCGGRLVKKTGPYGDFFGCENYKTTGCKYTRKIKSSNSEFTHYR